MKKNDLVVGGVYFLVSFLDEDLLVPDIKTYICIGANILGKSVAGVFFQDAEKYFEMGKWTSGELDSFGVVQILDDSLDCVHDYDGLQHEIELVKKGGARFYE